MQQGRIQLEHLSKLLKQVETQHTQLDRLIERESYLKGRISSETNRLEQVRLEFDRLAEEFQQIAADLRRSAKFVRLTTTLATIETTLKKEYLPKTDQPPLF